MSTASPNALRAALAAHRFGLGEPDALATVGDDARAWLLAQMGPADAQRAAPGDTLVTATEGLRRFAEFVQARRNRGANENASPRRMQPDDGSTMQETRSSEQQFGDHFREIVQADVRARLSTAATTSKPFAERLALFWCNHFTVSMAKASARGLVGAYEREAIRPHIAGRFEVLLRHAVMHPSMLRYLDNDQSAGPRSAVVKRRAGAPGADDATRPRLTGLNENLAREVLELHTLGATAARAGVYTQADVTAFAAVLTGWRVPAYTYLPNAAPPKQGNTDATTPLGDASPTRFDAAWHEPGAKLVLGQHIVEGPEGLSHVLRHLARHPATAQFIALKLARHFVADEPPAELVHSLAQAYLRSDGELSEVYKVLIDSPAAWAPQAAKLKTPEEMAISSARVLRIGARAFERQADAGISMLGQRVQAAPSPAGWPDAADEWLGPDAVWKRVEWATRVADRMGRSVDARKLAPASHGPLLSARTATQLDRAADGAQALALWLLSPEFQRR